MSNPTDAEIERTLAEVERQATHARNHAGHNGERHDGGHSATMAEIRAYRAGRSGALPPGWERVLAMMKREDAEERKEYDRLQSKFGQG